jgi:ubiquinone/menaquinone biosynthesis C-methylase UbiE
MLEVARRRPGGELVTWIEGDAAELSSSFADLAIMTGHVAQVFVADADWDQVLAHLFRALTPGGRLAFETRNPDAQGWKGWTRERTQERFRRDGSEPFLSWVEVTSVEDQIVRFDGHTVFENSGEAFVSASTLRFRTRGDVITSLVKAGFAMENLWGDWDLSAASPRSPELIFVGVKPTTMR